MNIGIAEMNGTYVFLIIQHRLSILLIIPPAYEVSRGYIVFAFSVTMFVCLSGNFFFPSMISQKLLDLGF